MLKKLRELYIKSRELISSKDFLQVIENFFSLSSLQGLRYLLSFLLIPLLLERLGSENYGVVIFADSFTQYFLAFTDFGFSLTATRDIAKNFKDSEKVNKIFNTTFFTQLSFLFIAFIILLFCVAFVPKIAEEKTIFFLTFGIVVGNVIFPVWFFQGMEQMRYITLTHTISKIVSVVLIVIFVVEPEDYYLVPAIQSLTLIIASIASVGFILKNFEISISLPTFKEMYDYSKESVHIFLSIMSTFLYGVNSRIFIAGLFVPKSLLGYYGTIEKVVNLFEIFPLQMGMTALFPRLSSIYKRDKVRFKQLTKQITFATSAFYFLITVFVIVFNEYALRYLLNDSIDFFSNITIILVISVFFLALNSVNKQILIISDHKQFYLVLNICTGALGIITIYLSTMFFGLYGTATSILIISILLYTLTSIYFKLLQTTK